MSGMRRMSALLIMFLIIFFSCGHKNNQQESTLNLESERKLSEENRGFLFFIVPKIKSANKEIFDTRQKILRINNKYDTTGFISIRNRKWLDKTADSFGLRKLDFDKSVQSDQLKNNIAQLLSRADVIPLKLVTAQACVESEWGRSRFAKEANNYFGVHCYMKGCGIAPKGVENPTFEVKMYSSAEEAVEDYLRIINTGKAYRELRANRARLRSKGNAPKAIILVNDLKSYSEKGQEYVDLLKGIMSHNLPKNLSDIN